MQAIFDSISNVQEGTIFRWTALLIGQAVIVFTVIMGYLGTRKKVSDVSDQATKAAELAEPTGNGFAKDMRDSMKFLSDAILRVEDKVDTHIQDHARQSLKD